MPSLTFSKTTTEDDTMRGVTEDDTMRDVASIVMESSKGTSLTEKKSYEDTDRQMAELYSPSDYQKLIEEVAFPAEKSHSFPVVTLSKPQEKECKSEPAYHAKEERPGDARVLRLEGEVRRLKELVDRQSSELHQARKQIDRLMLEHKKKEPVGHTSLLEKTNKFNSEPHLKPDALVSKKTNTV